MNFVTVGLALMKHMALRDSCISPGSPLFLLTLMHIDAEQTIRQ
jgi:hypothetical protein